MENQIVDYGLMRRIVMSELIINAPYEEGFDAGYEAGYEAAKKELQKKPFIRKREHYDSLIEQAVHEVDVALIDYRYYGKTTDAQLTRSLVSIGILKTLANHCHYENYHCIKEEDRPDPERRKRLGI